MEITVTIAEKPGQRGEEIQAVIGVVDKALQERAGEAARQEARDDAR